MGMSRGHSQAGCCARAAHSRDYALHHQRPPAGRLARYLHVVVLGPCSGAITGAASVATFPSFASKSTTGQLFGFCLSS